MLYASYQPVLPVVASECDDGFSRFFLTAAGIVLPVGVNVLTFLSCAILGVPGLLLAYGLSFIQIYV